MMINRMPVIQSNLFTNFRLFLGASFDVSICNIYVPLRLYHLKATDESTANC